MQARLRELIAATAPYLTFAFFLWLSLGALRVHEMQFLGVMCLVATVSLSYLVHRLFEG